MEPKNITAPTQPTPWRVRATSPDNYAVLDDNGMWVADVGPVRSEAVAIVEAVNGIAATRDTLALKDRQIEGHEREIVRLDAERAKLRFAAERALRKLVEVSATNEPAMLAFTVGWAIRVLEDATGLRLYGKETAHG